MAMTRTQWEKLQKRLPPEDRTSYEDYLATQGMVSPAPSKVAAKESGTIGAASIASQITPEIVQNIQNIPSPQATKGRYYNYYTGEYVDDPSLIKPRTDMGGPESDGGTIRVDAPPTKTILSVSYEGKGKNRVKITKYSDGTETREAAPEDDPSDGPGKQPGKAWILSADGKSWIKPEMPTDGEYTWDDNAGWTKKEKGSPSKTVTDTQILGSGANRFIRTYYSDGTYTDTPAPDTTGTGVGGGDAAFTNLLKSFQDQNNALLAQIAAQQAQAQIDAKNAAEEAKKLQAQNAITVLTDRFARYGLASLVPKIKELAISGASEDTITLQLQETEEYKIRFKANEDRIKKGLRVLSPSEYLGIEDDYRQILRAYGLKQFDTDAYVQQFISNDISTTELSNRVVTAVQRVQNADPAVLTTLRGYYGITDNDLVGYVLDPDQQFQKIERQVAAAEIGAAARLQGIQPGVTVAEQLAAQGITKAQAQKGYATIADILPSAEKLSDIYGKTMDGYRLEEAEQEVFNTLASAQRKRQKLVERELAAFGGTSGLGKSSLTQATGGQV